MPGGGGEAKLSFLSVPVIFPRVGSSLSAAAGVLSGKRCHC